jgi:starch-binding outer membrane protein, SusD/RagB family
MSYMKRKIILIILPILLVVVLPGCKKILEVTPQSSITDDMYFANEGDFEPYVTGIYTFMRSFANNITYGTERGEELVAALNSRFGVAWSQTLSPSSGAINYSDWYRAIGHCNLLLDRIAAFPFSSADAKKRITAEAFALRAYFYFHLTRIIGDAPVMLQVIDDANSSIPQLPRSSATDVMKQIQKDLDSSIYYLKGMSNFSVSSYPSRYRFAYASVQALKADAKLWSAKVLGGGTADFNDAITALNEVEASGRTLNADFKNVTGIRASLNPEIILAAYYLREESGANYGLNALPYLTGVQGALNLDSLPYANTTANGQGAYQISPKSKALFTNPADKRIPFTWVTERQASGLKISWITKYPGTKYADDRVSDNDLIIYRLADIFLMKAEAYAGLDNTPLAIQSLDKVRIRAGIGAYAGATDKSTVEKEILDERGREFFFENKRWYDLVRFHKGGTINVYTYVPKLVGKTTPLFWPLNTTVLGNNTLIKQTAGYQ